MIMNFSAVNKWISDHPTLFAIVLLFVVCTTAFFNSLDNGFLMDDHPMLIGNRTTNILQFLQLDFTDHEKMVYFRPFNHFYSLATVGIFKENPFGYNLISLILHYLTCLSIYYLFRVLFKEPVVALLTALLYCLHPINGMLITYKTLASSSVMIIATNLCLTNYLTALKEQNGFSNYVLSIIWFLLALTCHEVAILTPVFLLSILFILKKCSIKETLIKSLPLLTAFGFYLLFRMYFYSLNKNVLGNISFFQLSLLEYLACYTKLIFWYVSKLFYPEGIVLAWEIYRLSEATFFWVVIFFTTVILLAVLIFLYWKRDEKTFALIWLLSGIALVAIACFSRPALGFVLEPHWLCSASVGFFLLAALFLASWRKRMPQPLWLLIVAALVTFLFSKTVWYNQRWHSQKQYCQYWLSLAPHSYWPNFWLGYTYFEEKNYLAAKNHYTKVLNKGINIYEVYGNLGITEYNLGNYEQSIRHLEKALKIEPSVADTHYYLGLNYVTKNDPAKAEKYFLEAVRLDPYFVSPLEQLALLYDRAGQTERAGSIRKQIERLKKH